MSETKQQDSGPRVCLLCGSHFPETHGASLCPICEDERGLGRVPQRGHAFTTLEALRSSHGCEVGVSFYLR